MKDRSDDPSHHERMLLPQSYISLPIRRRRIIHCETYHYYDQLTFRSCWSCFFQRERERNVLFNDALNTFYLWLYGIRHMVNDHTDSERGNRCCHMDYSFQLAARVLLYTSLHRQDNTYHSLCYTSRETLAGTRNSSMGSTP